MLESSDVIAFASATDLSRARQFYEGVLGLRVVEQSDYACVCDAHGTMLRITAVSQVVQPGYTALGLRVADIATAMSGLVDAGVRFRRYDGMGQDTAGVWTTPNGDRIAWFADPDGNNLSLTQFA